MDRRPASTRDMQAAASPAEAVDRLQALYDRSASRLLEAVRAYIERGETPDASARAHGAFAYPLLRVVYEPGGPPPPISRAYGKFSERGVYELSVTRPDLFRGYLVEQLILLDEAYEIEIQTGLSTQEIPFSYVLDGADELDLDAASPAELVRHFPYADLSRVNDEMPNGERSFAPGETRALGLFDAPRTDYSLQRIRHYTGTPYEDVQQYILFTNYHRYVDAFAAWSLEQLQAGGPYQSFSAAGFVDVGPSADDALAMVGAAPWRRFQMPAYHLKAPGGQGVTLVNIGVGPSNAKTITDHLAVLRPQCWLMIGHCGGLRHSQRLGDYVLPHAYLRYDQVLDRDLPTEVPIPPIAEIQIALQRAVARVTGDSGEALKARLRTGTVVTYDDRNWELRYAQESRRINQSRAIAVDMESATIAANGYRMRVPYGALLCVSDKPLHGELKLPGAANRFYHRSVSEHLRAAIATVEDLQGEGSAALHSRKLRSFDEPPFR